MPNTLAHFGIQSLITRGIFHAADLKWVFLGCVIPDFPWILRRLVSATLPGIDVYDLRSYVIIQASLAFCLMIAAAFACCTTQPGRIFSILALNSFLHLVIDALQTKWANGVNLFAPVSWELLNFGWFWPESLPTYALTALGLFFLLWKWKETIERPPQLTFMVWPRNLLALMCVLAYFILPFAVLEGPEQANAHFIQTLKARENRPGHAIEFDRNDYRKGPTGDRLHIWTDEELQVTGHKGNHSGTVSIRGRFLSADHVEIFELHEHQSWFRDGASYVGLFSFALMWTWSILRRRAYQQFFRGKGNIHGA